MVFAGIDVDRGCCVVVVDVVGASIFTSVLTTVPVPSFLVTFVGFLAICGDVIV